MAGWLEGLFHGKEAWTFQAAQLRETAEELDDPRRGWYQIYPFKAERPLEEQSRTWYFEGAQQLAFLMVDIGAYRARAFDEETLANLRKALCFLRDQGKELIIRAAYDTEGKGMEREPARFELVCEHLEQLCRIVAEFAPCVFVWQGLLLGSWGEMHSSRFLTKPKLGRLAGIAERELPESVFLAMRRPVFYRMIRGENAFRQGEARIGLFDDAIFASDTHMGTYGWQSAAEAGWDDPWLPEEEQAFEHALCGSVPHGGEALMAESGPIPLAQAAERLRRLRVSYLNRDYDGRLLDCWRAEKWRSDDVWNGINGFDYIGRHLGYRFRVKRAAARIRQKQGQCSIRLEIENVGFAPCYQKVEAAVYHCLPTGEERRLALDMELRQLAGGECRAAECALELTPGKVYLQLRRAADGRIIRLGNEAQGDRVYLGEIRGKKEEHGH